MEAHFVINSFRDLISLIDKGIYNLISFLYEILEILAKKQIFTGDTIDSFATRIYTLLGLIMVFKVTFSLINYLVNPDMINDKSQGAGNVAKNIVVTLVLIIVTPYLFDFGYRLQSAILEDQVLPRLILETTETNRTALEFNVSPEHCKNFAMVDNYGDYIALMTLRPFYQLDETSDLITSDDLIQNVYCKANTTSKLLHPDLYKADEGRDDQNRVGQYIIDYSMILSTIAGAVVMIMLLTLCMDVAVRSIKLGFLEIVAPIPIISYIDPKSGKDGIFKKWYKEVLRTWASLFLKLTAIYFAIYVIELVGEADFSSDEHKIWVMLFLIIGALMFAKQFTKLIEDIFGIKLDGMSLNPIKKVKEQALGSPVTTAGMTVGTGIAGAIGGMAANTINNFKRRDDLLKEANGNRLKVAGKFLSQGIGGFAYGGLHGVKSGYTAGKDSKINIFGSTLDAIEKSSADRNLNETLAKQTDYKAPFAKQKYAIHNKMTDVLGLQGASGSTDELKNKLKALNAEKADVENQYRSAQETLSRLKSNSSDIFNDIVSSYGNPFKREYELDDNGHPKINKNGGMEFKPIQSFEDYMRNNAITFTSAEEADTFKREYTKMHDAEIAYRDSFNHMLEIQKTEGKLTKDQEKITNKKS